MQLYFTLGFQVHIGVRSFLTYSASLRPHTDFMPETPHGEAFTALNADAVLLHVLQELNLLLSMKLLGASATFKL